MPRKIPELAGVRQHHVNAGGLRMHVAEAGGGLQQPPLVCLHGWPQHFWMWRPILAAMSARRRVIAPDLRGFGWTDAPPGGYEKEQLATDVLALLDALRVDTFDLLAHDWGGWVACLLALRVPDRVRRLVALGIGSPVGGPTTRKLLPELPRFAYQIALAAPLADRVLSRWPGWVRGMLVRERDGRRPWKPADLDLYLDQLREPARARASMQLYRASLLRDLPAALAGRYRARRYAIPVRFVVGSDDAFIPPVFVRDSVERQGSDVSVDILNGVGHFLLDEAPSLVLERVLPFLEF